MVWKKRIAQASGATLGYITGKKFGITGKEFGAALGYELAGQAYDKKYATIMPPVTRSKTKSNHKTSSSKRIKSSHERYVKGKPRRNLKKPHRPTFNGKTLSIKNVGDHTVVKTHNEIQYAPQKSSKYFKIIGNKSIYDKEVTFGLTSSEGKQAIANLCYVFDATDTSAIFNNAAQFYNFGGTSYVSEAALTTNNTSQKFYVDMVKLEMRFRNQSPSTNEIDVYILMSKTSLTSKTSMDPAALWNNGLADMATNNTVGSDTTPYCVPTISKGFNQGYKVVKKMTVSLESGREWEHTFDYKPHAVVDMEYWANYATVRGLTYAVLYVVRGTLCDTVNGPAIGTISLTEGKIIGSLRKIYTSKLVTLTPRNYYQSNTMGTADSLTYQIIPETGVPVQTQPVSGVNTAYA